MRRAALLLSLLGLASLLYGNSPPTPAGQSPAVPPKSSLPAPSGKLTEQNKLEILRSVDGEFAKVVRPLPSLKPGFRLKPTGKVDQKALDNALLRSEPAANPGDKVQITGILFESNSIRVNINGGSHPHESWRNRIHISIGAPWPTSQVVTNQPPGLTKMGSTLIVEFGAPVPNVTPNQLELYLSPFLNFAEQRSAAKVWVDTLPPKFKQAIGRHQAVVGMNREMVIAALGRADHKVREFHEDGTETEDWIYGSPPGTTIFVTFIGERVVRVEQFP